MEKSFLVPCPPFDLKLSHLDRTFPPTHSKRILCFSLSPDVDRQRVVDYLYIAFHHTVQRVPFLAGSIVPFSEEEGGRPWLRNLIPQGNARLEIKDLSSELSFAELEKANFSQDLLDTEKLCPLPDVAYVSEEPVPVCAFQANFIEGGLLLVVSIVHIAADGRGVTQVINIFANQLVKAQSGELGFPLKQREDIYQSDRTVLVTGNGAQGAIENHAAWTSEPMSAHLQIRDVETSCRTFRISAKALVELKRVASAPSHGPDAWISTNDAITGFIWRSIMVARHRAGILADGATTHLAQPIDCRTLLRLPDPYFGNVLYVTKTSTPLAVIADDQRGIAEASFMVRSEISSMTGEKFRDLLAYAERTEKEFHTRGNIIEDLAAGGLMITSHFKFGLHEMDFGPIFGDGHMKALRLPATGTEPSESFNYTVLKLKIAISRQMLQELSQQIEEIHSEKSASGTRALILASAVDNVFCAGADLKERKKMSVSETQQFLVALRDMFSRLAALPIPTIACVSGLALGGGLELALCCHLRVFSSNARVGLPETRLAIIPGAGGTYRLSKIVGSSNALDLVLTGRHLEASEAASMGLCHRLVTADAEAACQSAEKQRALSIETGIALAQEICMGGPVAVRAAVSALAVPGEATENAAYDSVLETKDRIEALQAYSEKRKPIFTGE
ncbi:enoyl-CoA hydratase/isomerase family protein [Trichoderma guizhouense]|uniref:Enoyl-CoA hydratase/isomerase family protein n=1 Tax=Trichoderma guizhouense TaxID=1491466 RepID=A0A1T3CU23_9HYPO|nr:enoyl-CoA hydratase/isomerase family protein [Trichoderma guizhouense]